uniref:Uncharacterized protein n=1 Tax=Panagrellus redivivus TaxID=6233 RepID=A0A7E4UYE2_PANRE
MKKTKSFTPPESAGSMQTPPARLAIKPPSSAEITTISTKAVFYPVPAHAQVRRPILSALKALLVEELIPMWIDTPPHLPHYGILTASRISMQLRLVDAKTITVIGIMAVALNLQVRTMMAGVDLGPLGHTTKPAADPEARPNTTTANFHP